MMNGSMPAVQENSSSGRRRQRFANDNWGTAVTWGVGLLGYSPPEGPPVMELGSPLGGRLSGPGFLCHLIIHASPRPRHSTSEKKKKEGKKGGRVAPLSQPLAAALIAYWLPLLTTAGHRNISHWPRCQGGGGGGGTEGKVELWGGEE